MLQHSITADVTWPASVLQQSFFTGSPSRCLCLSWTLQGYPYTRPDSSFLFVSGQHYTFDDKQWQACAHLEQLQVHEDGKLIRWVHCIMLWLDSQSAGWPPAARKHVYVSEASVPHHAFQADPCH